MLTKEEITQRRRDISAYIGDHPSIGLHNIGLISDALNLKYKDVQNDVLFLREKLKKDYSHYGLEGLRDKAAVHVTRLKELQKRTSILVNSDDENICLKSIDTESKLINDIYLLEQDGIGLLTEEIDEKLEANKR